MASGDTLVTFVPQHDEAPTANAATRDARNSRPVLDFDAAANETALFTGVMPENYGGGGVNVKTFYMMSSAVAGDVDLDVSWENENDGDDLDADAFAAVNSTDNTTVPATSGILDDIDVTFTDGADMDSVGAGDVFRLKITRDAVSDTAAGDFELRAVHVTES